MQWIKRRLGHTLLCFLAGPHNQYRTHPSYAKTSSANITETKSVG